MTYWPTDGLLDALHKWTITNPAPGNRAWGLGIYLYPLSGPKISSVGDKATAYGGRDAKWIIHYKHSWSSSSDHNKMMSHHRSLSRALDQHTPCKGFYNYADKDFTCAGGSNRKWMEAHFSDVRRMESIKQTHDPTGVFHSRLTPG